MSEPEGGGSKILRGFLIAVAIVAAIIAVALFWRQIFDGLEAAYGYISDQFPTESSQQAAVIVYMVIAALFGVLFSKAGHFIAYGLAIGLGSLLWILFWMGFPAVGLEPPWAQSAGLGNLPTGVVLLWAAVAVGIITVVFVPLELWEKFRRRKRSLDTD
jgi:undecaprenyl pyrophosphate phosphatase UppP